MGYNVITDATERIAYRPESATHKALLRDSGQEKKAIKQESPNIGTRALSKAINQRIKEVQKLMQKQNQPEKAAVKQAVERSIDYIQNQVNKSNQ